MDSFVWFLGRFHVLVLHLPLGILTLAVVFEVLARSERFIALRSMCGPLWVAGALSAFVTVVLGYMHASEEAFQGLAAVEAHRRAGVWLCVVAGVGAVLRVGFPRLLERLWLLPVVAVSVLMVLTGHLGGNLTHGDKFLVQYAPGPLRALAGLPATAAPRPRPADLASADIFLDVIQPALERRCASCHNDSKRSGGLSVVSHARLMEGGKTGAVIVPGNPEDSDLLRRVSLSPSSEDFMPKEGKPPLSQEEVAVLAWWIEAGAPQSGLAGALDLPPATAASVSTILGLAPPAGTIAVAAGGSGEDALPEVPPVEESVLARVVADGFIVRRVAQDSNLLDVDYASPVPLGPEPLEHLAELGPNVLRLNLRNAGLADASLKRLQGLENLRYLRLERNNISDEAVEMLASLASLTSLNLTGTRLTDRGLEKLVGLKNLKVLYVWDTAVSPATVTRVANERKDLRLVAGLRAADVPPPGKVVPPDS